MQDIENVRSSILLALVREREEHTKQMVVPVTLAGVSVTRGSRCFVRLSYQKDVARLKRQYIAKLQCLQNGFLCEF